MSTTAPSSTGLSSYVNLLRRNRNYRYLWFGQIVSLLGDWFNLIASAALIGALTQSGLAIGGLFVVRFIAPFVVSPVAGVFADRYNRKTLLIAADLGRAVVVLGFLLVREPSQVWLLYVLTAIQLGLSGFFFPARSAILPDIVGKADVGTANALGSATWSVMLGLGAALGGLMAGWWGAYPAFIIDAVTFLLSAVLLTQVAYEQQSGLAQAGQTIADGVRQYVEGLAYMWHDKDILAISLHKGVFALVASGAASVWQVKIAEELFVYGEGGGTGLGIIYAVTGIGTGIGPIVARHFTGDRESPLRRAIGLGYGIGIVGSIILAPLGSFAAVLLGMFVRGIGGSLGWVFSTQLLLQLAPDDKRGRVFGTEFAMFTLMNAIGAAWGGWALDLPDVTMTGLIGLQIGLLMIPAILWFLWVARLPVRENPATLPD